MKKTTLFTVFACALLLVSCGKEIASGGEDWPTGNVIVTGDVTDITHSAATFYGYANVTPDMGNVSFGIVYSTNPTPTAESGTVLVSDELDANNRFCVSASGLRADTRYYYRARLVANGTKYYSEEKSFVTSAPIHVTGVSLDQSRMSLIVGTSSTLTATVLPDKAIDKSVTWSSSNPSVASVSSFGIVSAVSAGTATITVKTTDGSKTATCIVSVTPATVLVTKVEILTPTLTLIPGDTQTLIAVVTPDNATNPELEWTSSNPAVAYVSDGFVMAMNAGTAIVTATSTDGSGVSAKCVVTVSRPSGAVDLGLSVKWASCNLGASSPEEYGGYYQWVGTEDVTSTSIYLDDSNCPYHSGSDSESGWTKYVPSGESSYWSGSGSPDNKTVLDPEDDVAHVKLGGSWRMPTAAEWKELIDNCTWTWITLNGKNGYNVTSKKNGNFIFLPAAGNRDLDNLLDVGFIGLYWSSSLYTFSPRYAYFVLFYSSNFSWYYGYSRCYGQSVRPVSE